jgi:adenine specific DNA methylase Mod
MPSLWASMAYKIQGDLCILPEMFVQSEYRQGGYKIMKTPENIDFTNNIIYGDSFEWIFKIPSNIYYDLIYLDPPWPASSHEFTKTDKISKEDTTFKTTWKRTYFELKKQTEYFLSEVQKRLKKTGSLFVHCDYNAAGPLRVILEDIFGTRNFIREIYWVRYRGIKMIIARFSLIVLILFFGL